MTGARPCQKVWKVQGVTLFCLFLFLFLCCDGLLVERMRGGLARVAGSKAPKPTAEARRVLRGRTEIVVTKRKQGMKRGRVKSKPTQSSILLDMNSSASDEMDLSAAAMPSLNVASDSLWSNGREDGAAHEDAEALLDEFDHMQAAMLNESVKRRVAAKSSRPARPSGSPLREARAQSRRSPQKRNAPTRSKLSAAEAQVLDQICGNNSGLVETNSTLFFGLALTLHRKFNDHLRYVHCESVQRAERFYIKSISLNQSDPTVFYWWSKCLLEQYESSANATKLSLAMHAVKRGLEKFPSHVDLLVLLAEMHIRHFQGKRPGTGAEPWEDAVLR
ncbi:hypothetical protein GUITHDRAFT_114699 [Guillardia theta CCMP2712]|uniref:Uncharacterized protein n=1 Tax=Guillardia theta (strain CCMP2712) TaxID=905079 RepID=L1ITW2_GUITC|nr:hypothetical protein GUITHDRAFT_114699 [Guillardia theta CCMP2712]EKX39265.1 hypothetical protein GUITHDRAFT_114699 [Guillardia theta CCMP2712]|eukprot:XP_005826245.1 hypothetical protein GUITHDRAFT_114699 [Guillardia theta CCMP2712]